MTSNSGITLRGISLSVCLILLSLRGVAQSDVIMQGFYWNSSPGDITSNDGVWWDSLAAAADELAAAGFSTVWTPPANKGFAGVFDMGYGTYDYFDLGEFNQKGTIRTRHGSKSQLEAMINALHAAGIEVMADIVLNHRAGAENQQPEDCEDGDGQQLRFTDFNPASGRLPMDAPHFHPNALPGHCNLFGPYHDRTFFEDLCYFNFINKELDPSAANDGWYFGPHDIGAAGDSLIIWGRYLLDEVGFDAVRLDAVKHVEPGFLAPFIVELNNGNQAFAIGEFFDGNAGAVASYHQDVEQFVSTFGTGSKDANLAMFDFPLRFTLRDMANDLGGGFDMWNLNFRGLLLDGAALLDGEDIVTFIENHDTDRGGFVVTSCPGDVQIGSTCLEYTFDAGHDPVIFDKHMAYAYIMAAEGRPTVFWKDWYWYHLDEEIKWQMALRSTTAVGGTTPVMNLNPFSFDGLIGDDLFSLRRNGTGSGADGAMLMLNDDASNTYSFFLDSPAGWANGEAKDYSDAFMFETTQVFGDGRALYKCHPRNYSWYAPTGLYPQTPGETPSAFALGDHHGAKLHYIILRASDAANLLVNGEPIAPGDQVAVVPAGESIAAGLGRVGQSFTWDGVHDMVIEVLGGGNLAEANGGLLNGEAFDVVVWDAGAGSATTITSIAYAPSGTNFNFSADRPNSRGGDTPFGLTTTHGAGTYLTGGITLITAFEATTFICEGSNASASAYDDGWQSGDNDGSGFEPWTISTQNNNPETAGHFIFTSTSNGDGDGNADGDIDTGGRAWGMYANNGDVSNAVRPFTNALVEGATFSLHMDNGWIEGGGTVGFGLQNDSGQNLFELFFTGGQVTYEFVDEDGVQPIPGAAFTDEGLEFTFTLTGVNTYSASLTQLINGSVYSFSGALSPAGGGNEISRVRLFNANAGPAGERNAYFNSFEICVPYCIATDPDRTLIELTTCDPDSAGNIEELFTNRFGCDSIVTTTTLLLPSDITYMDITTCNPDDDTIKVVLTNRFGCDSVVVTVMVLLPRDTTYIEATTCDPDSVSVTEAEFTNRFGCDSLVITTTTLLPLPVADVPVDCEVVYPAYADSACVLLTVTVIGGTAPYTYAWTNDVEGEFLETTSSIAACPDENTVYSVVVTDANGCTSSDIVEVKAVDITSGNNKVFICHAENQKTLSIHINSVPDHLAHGDKLGKCNDPDPCAEPFAALQAASDVFSPFAAQDVSFTLYPNPAEETIILQFEAIEEGAVEIVVFNADGRETYAAKYTTFKGINNLTLEIDELVQGMYFVRVQDEEVYYYGRFVKGG